MAQLRLRIAHFPAASSCRLYPCSCISIALFSHQWLSVHYRSVAPLQHHTMLLSIHVWDVIDASIACAAVNIFAALYCWSKWAYAVELPGSRRSSTLIWQSLGFGLVEIAFLAAFVKLWMDESNATFVLLRLWEVNSETSISCFLVSVLTSVQLCGCLTN